MIGTRPEPPYTELCGSTPAHGPVKPVRYSPPCLPPGAGLKEPAAGEAAALPPPGAGVPPEGAGAALVAVVAAFLLLLELPQAIAKASPALLSAAPRIAARRLARRRRTPSSSPLAIATPPSPSWLPSAHRGLQVRS